MLSIKDVVAQAGEKTILERFELGCEARRSACHHGPEWGR